MKKLKSERGFTLIELLIVVAIIAILATVVLAALNNARIRGGDAGVKSNLRTIPTQAELFFTNNGNSYQSSAGGGTVGVCPSYLASSIWMINRDKVIADAIAKATTDGGNGNYCYNTSDAWAVAVGLKTSGTTSWCVDSTGVSKQVNIAPSGAINISTGACN